MTKFWHVITFSSASCLCSPPWCFFLFFPPASISSIVFIFIFFRLLRMWIEIHCEGCPNQIQRVHFFHPFCTTWNGFVMPAAFIATQHIKWKCCAFCSFKCSPVLCSSTSLESEEFFKKMFFTVIVCCSCAGPDTLGGKKNLKQKLQY